jgi:chromosomal replication initiation ATPase DnaA
MKVLQQQKEHVKALRQKLDELETRGLLQDVRLICSREGAIVEEIFGDRRSAHIARARRMVWWELKDRGWTYAFIGEFFNREHSTVMSGIQRAARELGLKALPGARAMKEAA